MIMNVLVIFVDKHPVQLLQRCESVTSLIIQHHQGIPIPIAQELRKPIAEWIYDLSQRASSIMYNGVLIEKESVAKGTY